MYFHKRDSVSRLLLSLLSLLVVDEVVEEVRSLGLSNNADVVAEEVLLKVLLGKVLDVTLSKGGTASNSDGVVVAGNEDGGTNETDLGVLGHLDTLSEESLVVSNIKELVIDRLRAVDGVLNNLLGGLALGSNTL